MLPDSVLSKSSMFVTLSSVALLAHLPMWGIVVYSGIGDEPDRYRVPIALAASGSGAAVAWAAQRKGATLSTAMVGSTLGAAAAWGLASAAHDRGLPMLIGVLVAPVVHGALAALITSR